MVNLSFYPVCDEFFAVRHDRVRSLCRSSATSSMTMSHIGAPFLRTTHNAAHNVDDMASVVK